MLRPDEEMEPRFYTLRTGAEDGSPQFRRILKKEYSVD